MRINGWDISRAQAKQWQVTQGYHSVKNNSEWTAGSPMPVLLNGRTEFKELTVRLMVYGHGRHEVEGNISTILSHLLEPVELQLDKFTHFYKGVMTKYTVKAVRQVFGDSCTSLELKFNCYEYGTEVTATKATAAEDLELRIVNPGNIITPAVVTLTAKAAVGILTIQGLSRDSAGREQTVTVKALAAGVPVTLDGEKMLFTEGTASKAKDMELWTPPTLLAGLNHIVLDQPDVTVQIKYHPRYM